MMKVKIRGVSLLAILVFIGISVISLNEGLLFIVFFGHGDQTCFPSQSIPEISRSLSKGDECQPD